MAKNIGEAALAVARRELGVKESPAGSNDGPRVRVFLRNLGLPPAPWCAAFVEWCLEQVGWERGPWRTAYVPDWVAAGEAGERGMRVLGTDELPRPGDLACYDWPLQDQVADHIGIVESVTGPTTFRAVEGNTAVGNDSNGGEVMLRTRSRADTMAILRLPSAKVPLATRLRAAGYGARTVPVILRNLREGVAGRVPNPRDREMFDNLRREGLGAASARRVVKSLRRAK